jgi:hypothetical protein
MLIAEFGTGQVFWSVLWITLFVIWIWLLFAVFSDIFRSGDLSGWGKAIWSIFIILVPYLGVFVYIIARGHKMQEHAVQAAAAQEAALRDHIQAVAGSDSPAEQIAKLAELRDRGVIDDAEFQRLKGQAMA